MKKTTIIVIIAVSLLGCGILLGLTGTGMMMRRLDRLTPEEAVEQQLQLDGEITSIRLSNGIGDIYLLPADEAGPRMVATGYAQGEINLSFEGGKVSVSSNGGIWDGFPINFFGLFRMDWLGHIRLGSTEPRVIKVYLPPHLNLTDMELDTGLGNFTSDPALTFSADTLNVNCGAGETDLSNLTATSARVSGGLGSVYLTHGRFGDLVMDLGTGDVIAQALEADRLTLHGGLGGMTLKDSSFGEAQVDAGTGDVTLDGMTARDRFNFNGGLGSVLLQNASLNNATLNLGTGDYTFEGALTGKSRVNLGLGSVEMIIRGDSAQYEVTANPGLGDMRLYDQNGQIGWQVLDGQRSYNAGQNLPNTLYVQGGTGDFELSFTGQP